MKKIYCLLTLTFILLFSIQKTNAQCLANFSYTTTGDTAVFTDLSTAGFGTIVAWGWNFGDGNFGGTQNPTHVYAIGGQYIVSLTITTSAFCFNTFTDTITVTGNCSSNFTYNSDTTSGNTLFQGTPFSSQLTYTWNFGDGNIGTGAFATNQYAASGTYYTCLTINDTAGFCNSTFCDSVVIYIAPANCTTTFTSTNNGNGNVTFQVQPFHFGTTYTWNFGNGATGNGGFTFNSYATYGTYYVCLTATDSAAMCTSSFCDTLILAQDTSNCNVSFTYFNNNGQVGFTATPASANNDYSWIFGDGNTGTGVATTNTYSSSGTYYVCVGMNNTFNACSSTFCDSVVAVISGIEERYQNDFSLNTFPNPLNDISTISYTLKADANVQLLLTDILGNSVCILSNEHKSKGKYSKQWNAAGISNGTYLLQLKVNDQISVKRIVINK